MRNILAAVGMLSVAVFLMAAGNAISPTEPAYDWECSINGSQPTPLSGVLKTQDGVMIIEGPSLIMAGTNLTCMRTP